MSERGQTVHDYLLGILIVLITVSGVFAFFPGVFTPFQESVDSENFGMAERLADKLVAVNATAGDERTVHFPALNKTLQTADRFDSIAQQSGIPNWKLVNVTVRKASGKTIAREDGDDYGSTYRPEASEATATGIRTFVAHNRTGPCGQSCRLIVRVWTG